MIFSTRSKIWLTLYLCFGFIFLHAQNNQTGQLTSILQSPLNVQSCDNFVKLSAWPDAINVGDLSVTGNKITVEAMINRTTPYTGGSLYAGNVVSKHDRPVDVNYLLRPNHAEITTTNGYFRTPDICEIKLNKTYHVAMVYDGTTLKFYRNGFLMSLVNVTGQLVQNAWSTVIGSKYFAGFHTENFVGYINEVRIWNVARTQSELRTYMNTPLPNPASQTGLLAYYAFDNLLNKQGNPTWNATIVGTANLNQTNPTCAAFVIDSCDAVINVNSDFTTKQDVCNPLSVQFSIAGNIPVTQKWIFGDGTGVSNSPSPVYVYPAFGNYPVSLIIPNGASSDTITKTISIKDDWDDIIITPDTVICTGSPKQIRTKPSLRFCWSPTTFLDNPNSPNPITNAKQNITYHFQAEITGNNLIVNSDFSAGNTGFQSGYNFANPNISEGQFFVGPDPKAWNSSLDNCRDHTSGSGNMMLINGSPVPDVEVWTQTISISPNTNYAFSTWLQALWPPNPAQLQFSINGKVMGSLFTANLPTCTWKQFYTTWNSGKSTTATISIVNKNSLIQGNDFALDDISFAPVFIKHDSVVIKVENPVVKTNNDTLVCSSDSVQLNTTGAANYSWSPGMDLSNTTTSNPVAKPQQTISYIVTGTTVNGCVAKDTILIAVHPKPIMTGSNDTTVCPGTSVQLFATGGLSYHWSPGVTLNDPGIFNPIAKPLVNTKYSVLISDINSCIYSDTVAVTVRPYPIFTTSKDTSVCEGSQISLHARGGKNYVWSSTAPISNPNSPDIIITPAIATQYSVYISEDVCNSDSTVVINVSVNQNPLVVAQKSNDIDCAVTTSRLNASGALKYNWNPSAGLDHPDQQITLASIDTTTIFTVTGTDQFGCFSTDSVSVAVTKSGNPGFVLPNAFTPNNDGKNDCFGIKKWGNVQIKEFSVYNRWGERIFITKDPNHCWDGRYNGIPQGTGGYVYVIRAVSFCGEVKRKGIVTLIR